MVSTTRRFTWALGLVGLAVVAVGTITAFNMGHAASQRELIGKRPVTCKLWSEGRNEHLTDEDKNLCRQLHYAPPTQATMTCWRKMPTGCDRTLSEQGSGGTGLVWFVDPNGARDEAQCIGRVSAFNNHCGRTDAMTSWAAIRRTPQGNAEADRAVVGKQMFDDLAGTYYKAVDRASAEGKVIDDKKTFEFYNDMAEIINDNKQFVGEKQVPYLKLPVTASCLVGTFISTGKECSQAIAALGIVGLNTRWEQPTGDGSIPLGCSVREEGNDRRAHFNHYTTGHSRKDLAPICSVKARAPPAPPAEVPAEPYPWQTGEMGKQQRIRQTIEDQMAAAIAAAKFRNDDLGVAKAQSTGKMALDNWRANQAAMFGSAAVY